MSYFDLHASIMMQPTLTQLFGAKQKAPTTEPETDENNNSHRGMETDVESVGDETKDTNYLC